MNKNDLSLLLARGRISVPGILSVYLSLAHDAVSAKRAYVKALKQMAAATRRTIAESAEREKFDAAVRHVEGFLSEYSPAAK
jgi:hypothetical protein